MKASWRKKNRAKPIRFLELVFGVLKNAMYNVCSNRKRKEEQRESDGHYISGLRVWTKLEEFEQYRCHERIEERCLVSDVDISWRRRGWALPD